jgi:hypothetical protein
MARWYAAETVMLGVSCGMKGRKRTESTAVGVETTMVTESANPGSGLHVTLRPEASGSLVSKNVPAEHVHTAEFPSARTVDR